MKRIGLVILLLIAFWSITPLASSNAYLDASMYETITVKSGDTVWGIAAQYVTAKDDIRDLSQAIRQLNGLNKNAQICPGQALKIPMKQ